MKKNKTVLTVGLAFVTVILLASTLYISSLLSTPASPTQVKKTKAAAIAYTKTVNFADFPANSAISPPADAKPSLILSPIVTGAALPKAPSPILIAQVPTLVPTSIPTSIPTIALAKIAPSATPLPPSVTPSPTLQPLLAYKSTSISPTLIPLANTGGMTDPTKAPTPTKKIVPTGVQQLPETGWIQTSSILFIVATSTILFSLLY